MKLLSILLISATLLSTTIKAEEQDSLVLTCDFTTSGTTKVAVDYPKGCSGDVGKYLKNDRYLPENILFMAKPPKCPFGYNDLNIKQGGRTSSGHAHQTNSYQVRRICVTKTGL
jgi:hypothetical protein